MPPTRFFAISRNLIGRDGTDLGEAAILRNQSPLLVAVVQARLPHLAAILATMKLTIPLAMWIVFSATHGDRRQSAEFAGSMVLGSVASRTYILTAWLGFGQEWGFTLTVGFAAVVWLVMVSLSHRVAP
jgi:hypothetical protein